MSACISIARLTEAHFICHGGVIYPRSFFNLARLTNNLADAGKRFSCAPVRIRLTQHNKHNK
ncbi:hypothetical protein FCI58_29095, partial [Enterobacter hormaechei]|nr:hypothetical protein [Enterobacter hormaechei]